MAQYPIDLRQLGPLTPDPALHGQLTERPPVLAAWGGGVNSTAMIIELVARGEPPDAALLAEMPERPETLEYIPMFRRWMDDHGVPNETVSYTPKRFKHWPPYYNLLENLLTNGTLPSISFGRHSCSLGPASETVSFARDE